jgi:hypothetical protein
LLGTRGAMIAGKVGYAASCLVAAVLLVVSGYAHRFDGLVSGLASSNAISGGAQTGAMNILLMGLESRTDYQGNTLSSALLTAMHAGSVYGVDNEGVGGQDTNTLILIHIFAGGQLLDPARRLGHVPAGVRRSVAGEDRPGLRPRLRAVPESDRELVHEPCPALLPCQ